MLDFNKNYRSVDDMLSVCICNNKTINGSDRNYFLSCKNCNYKARFANNELFSVAIHIENHIVYFYEFAILVYQNRVLLPMKRIQKVSSIIDPASVEEKAKQYVLLI